MTEEKDCWDKAAIIAKIFGAILTPLLIGVFGYLVNKNLKEREIAAEYVTLATQVLQSSDTTASYREMREYAVDLLGRFSPIDMDENLREALISEGLITISPEVFQGVISRPPRPLDLRVQALSPHRIEAQIRDASGGRLMHDWMYRKKGENIWLSSVRSAPGDTVAVIPVEDATTYEVRVQSYIPERDLLSLPRGPVEVTTPPEEASDSAGQ